ncbi:MAG: carbon-monoxide dehydrogenase medium subunit [Cellvibrionaceae bacterium]|jgi:carbon-monoxide dehydrogenase medium subunit
MYPPKFDYHRASSVEEAIALRKEHDGKFLAGGHSLIPVMKLRLADPGCIVDIGRIENLKGICPDGDSVKIGALTTHGMVESSDELPDALPEAAGWIGDPMVRNRGTVGGNIAHADPASDLPTVLIALGGSMTIASESGSRTVSADKFFTGLFETALGEDELLTGVSVPAKAAGTGTAYAKLFNPASRYAIVGAAASMKMKGNVCESATIAIGGLVPASQRCASVEAALNGKAMNEKNIAEAAAAVVNDLGDDILSDIHASADYRRAMATVFVKRAITKAVDRA